MRGILVGPDFALGKGKEGNIDVLRSLGCEMGFSVDVIPPFRISGEIVSSTLIRRALAQGDMRKVAKLMERYFYLEGKVISAEKRGRVLGYPTANLDIEPQQALPGNGIYATIAQVEGRHFPSATNVGTRPTFGAGEEMVETHLLNYKGNLYDKCIRVEFVQKLRDEERFPSPEELKVITEPALVQLLKSGRSLTLKQGFDPSAPDIHLGHVVGLRKLRQFQELGHKVALVVGDWTARIGDPSGQSATRPMLTADEIERNAQTYMEQFSMVVDKDKTELRWQSEWFSRFTLDEVIRLTSKFYL
jgi:hypothetical protein